MGRQNWIRADVRLAPGQLRAVRWPNAEGRVIGINTAIVDGLGVAVPSQVALEFLRRGARALARRGAASGGSRAAAAGGGTPEGAAANAGLRAGDILLTRYDALD